MQSWRNVNFTNLKWSGLDTYSPQLAYQWTRKKVQTIVEWATPCTLCDVQCFLGFVNFYRIFIKNYSKIATPLICLTGKEFFSWNDQMQEAFDSLKLVFSSAPILIHVDFTKPFFLESDASNDQMQEAFDSLKLVFYSAPILIHVDFTKPSFLE
jgi:hypothetical protein